MKKSLTVFITATLCTLFIFASSKTPAEKVESTQNKVTNANKNLGKVDTGYLADMAAYRKATTDKIEANNKSIAAFNARIAHEKKSAKADYKKKIDALQRKNSDMKKRMDDYKADGKDKWEIFKIEFSHDMDGLGKAFKGLTVKNTK